MTVQLSGKEAPPAAGDYAVLDLPDFWVKGTRVKLRAGDGILGAVAIVGAMAQISKAETPCETWGCSPAPTKSAFTAASPWPSATSCRAISPSSRSRARRLRYIAVGAGPVVRLGDKAGPLDPRATALVAGAARALTDKKVPPQTALAREAVCEGRRSRPSATRRAAVSRSPATQSGPAGVGCEEIDLRDVERARGSSPRSPSVSAAASTISTSSATS